MAAFLGQLAAQAAKNPQLMEAAGNIANTAVGAAGQALAAPPAPMPAISTPKRLIDLPAAQAFATLVGAGVDQEVAAINTGVWLPSGITTGGGKRRKTKRRKHKKTDKRFSSTRK